MEINSVSASVYQSAYERPAAQRKASAQTPASTDTVDISPQAAQAYASDQGAEPSPSKLFAYGALGFQRPEANDSKPTDAYDVGRWIAAGVEVATILSVLV